MMADGGEQMMDLLAAHLDALIRLLRYFIKRELDNLHKNGVRLQMLGHMETLPDRWITRLMRPLVASRLRRFRRQGQITRLGGANFAPSWHPDGKRLIFASNIHDPKGRDFDIYMINVDGTGLERITFNDTFDGFPMFSPDGTKLVFASNRNAKTEGETNVFIADWKP